MKYLSLFLAIPLPLLETNSPGPHKPLALQTNTNKHRTNLCSSAGFLGKHIDCRSIPFIERGNWRLRESEDVFHLLSPCCFAFGGSYREHTRAPAMPAEVVRSRPAKTTNSRGSCPNPSTSPLTNPGTCPGLPIQDPGPGPGSVEQQSIDPFHCAAGLATSTE